MATDERLIDFLSCYMIDNQQQLWQHKLPIKKSAFSDCKQILDLMGVCHENFDF